MKQLYNPEVIENMRASRRLAGKQSSKATQRRKGFFSPAETRVATKENMSNILNQRTETPDKIVNNWLESLDSAREEAISQISDRKNTNTPREDSIETQNKKEPFPEKDYPVSKREDVSGALILTPRQAELLERVVWAEAGNQGVKGRNAVRGVILNRIASDRFPNTLEEVLTQSGQFEPVGKVKGDLYAIKAPTARLDQQYFELLNYLDKGEDASQGSTFFLNRATAKKRGTDFKGKNPLKIGSHTFYSSYGNQEPVIVPDNSHNVVIKRKNKNV